MNMDSSAKIRSGTCIQGIRLAWEFFVRWAGAHQVATACATIILSTLPLLASLNARSQGDIKLYHSDADAIVGGQLAYRDILIEYPPYAIAVFLLPRLLASDNYTGVFMLLVLLCDFLLKGLLLLIGWSHTKSLRGLNPLFCYCAAVPWIRYFYLQRFDVWPALTTIVALWLFSIEKPGWSGCAMAVGIGIKVYPAVFMPQLMVLAIYQRKARRFLMGSVLGLLPMLLLSFVVPWWRFVYFQGDRGLQCESLVASIIWMAKNLGLTDGRWVWMKRWFEVQGTLASELLPWARGLFVIAVASSVAIACLAAARCPKPSVARLARLLLFPLLGFVAFNQVLSPQFMVWLLPLAALSTLEEGSWMVLGIPLATMLTPIIFPSFTGNYGRGLNSFETVVLLARNGILVGVWWSLLKEHLRFCRIKRD
jgi:hypothetical protein